MEEIDREELQVHIKEAILYLHALWDKLNLLEDLLDRNVEQEDIGELAMWTDNEITEEDLNDLIDTLLKKERRHACKII